MNIAITFATLSGHTLIVAEAIRDSLMRDDHSVKIYDMLSTPADKLKDHDLVFIGSSTYGDGDLNPIAEMFFLEATSSHHGCDGTKFAIFALGDSSYPTFANSGQLIDTRLSAMNAQIVQPILRLDGYPTETDLGKAIEWANAILASLK